MHAEYRNRAVVRQLAGDLRFGLPLLAEMRNAVIAWRMITAVIVVFEYSEAAGEP
jgi:hypothetical protein